MSLLKQLGRSIVGCFLLALFPAFLAALAFPWGEPFTAARAPQLMAAVFLAGLALVFLSGTAAAAVQVVPLLRYWGRPAALLDQVKRDLDSPQDWKRRRALQLLADHFGHPFGYVYCWPLGTAHGRIQLRNMVLLYKEWLRVRDEFAQDKTILPHIVRRMQSPAKIAVWRTLRGIRLGRIRPPSPEWKLPPVPAEELVAELRGRVEGALRETADILNHAQPDQLRAAESRVRDVLAELVWDALESAIRLAIGADAASREERAPARGPLVRRAEAALDRANEAVKDAVLDIGIEDEEAAPYPERRPLPPLAPDKLAAALRPHVEQTMKAFAERVNAARDLEGIASADEEVRRLFETLAGTALELAAGLRVDAAADKLPWSAAQGEWARRLRRMTALDSVVVSSAEEGKQAGA